MIAVFSALQGSTPIATRRLHVTLRPHIQNRQKSTPPDFAIAGVEKGGTTGLAWHLRFFSVCMYGETEYHKVDSITFLRRPTWPRPRTGCNVTGFDDPNLFYIAPTHAAQLRMAAPAIRLVVLLREPVQRAHSRWQMEVERNFAATIDPLLCRSFEACIFKESSRLHAPPRRSLLDIVRRGLYSESLEALARVGFVWDSPSDSPSANASMIITISERLFANPLHEYNRVLSYLGAPIFDRLPIANRMALRTGTYIHKDTLTPPVAAHLYALYYNSTQSVYKRVGERIHEWEVWYEARNLSVVRSSL